MSVPLYAVTKAANESMAREWAVEFGHSRGINVNGTFPTTHFTGTLLISATAVAPGLVATEILDIVPEEVKGPFIAAESKLVAAAPRIGQPDDIAQVVAFLASEGARWITGSTINASGGRYFF
jgi:3-oxoacyl-[acyl-carrier protein] reductase